MLGIPAENSPEYLSFTVSFWAALYSGLISSLFTGLIVGLVIWRLQIKAERRAQKEKFEEELQALKESLKQINFGQNPINISSATESIPQEATEIVKLIEGKPIKDWGKQLNNHKDFIEQLRNLKKQKLEFDKIAGQLDSNLSQFVRTYNAERHSISTNDKAHVNHFIARLHGLTYDQISKWLYSDNQQTLEESWQLAQNDTRITSKTKPYLEARDKLTVTIGSIEQTINES